MIRLQLLKHEAKRYTTRVELWAVKESHKYKVCEVFKGEKYPYPSDFDWLIVLGGSQHSWEEDIHPWLKKEKEFINDAIAKNKIILGICFGAQLVAEVLGGKAFTNTHPEIGWHDVFIASEGEKFFLFQNLQNKFTSFHWHYDHFSLPSNCARLTFTRPTPNQAFCCNNRPIVGLQFHPELKYSSIKYFCDLYCDELVNDRYVTDKDAILTKIDMIPEQDWLMYLLLDNMMREYG